MTQLPAVDTPRKPVTDIFHGVEVVDEYRWLEDESSEATRKWTAEQDARTRAYLEALPFRGAIRRRCEEILGVESTRYDGLSLGGSTYFALKTQPPHQQPFLVALDRLDDTAGERVLVDPNAVDDSGATTIDWYHPSPDGSRVAVSLSEHGTEDGTVYVHDVATGEIVDGPLPHVNSGTAGGSLAWRADSGGFWCTWHAAPGSVPDADLGFYQEVWFHEVGTDESHPGACGRVRRGPDRRELPVGVARRTLGDGPRPEGRRRGVAGVCSPAGGRRALAVGRRPGRRVHPRGVRRPLAVSALDARCAGRAGAAPRARRHCDRRRCDGGRAARGFADRGDRRYRWPAVGGGHRRRPLGDSGVRPRRKRA